MKVKYVLTALISTIIIIIAIILLVSSAKRQKIRRERLIAELDRRTEKRTRRKNVFNKMDSLKKKYHLREHKEEFTKRILYVGMSTENEEKPDKDDEYEHDSEIETSLDFHCPYFFVGYGGNNKGELSSLIWKISYTVNKDGYGDPDRVGYIEFSTDNNYYSKEYNFTTECDYDDWAWYKAYVSLNYNDIKMLKDIMNSGYKADVIVGENYGNDTYYGEIKIDQSYERIIKAYEEIEKYLSRY